MSYNFRMNLLPNEIDAYLQQAEELEFTLVPDYASDGRIVRFEEDIEKHGDETGTEYKAAKLIEFQSPEMATQFYIDCEALLRQNFGDEVYDYLDSQFLKPALTGPIASNICRPGTNGEYRVEHYYDRCVLIKHTETIKWQSAVVVQSVFFEIYEEYKKVPGGWTRQDVTSPTFYNARQVTWPTPALKKADHWTKWGLMSGRVVVNGVPCGYNGQGHA